MGQKGKCEDDEREAPAIEGVAEAPAIEGVAEAEKRKEGRFESIEEWRCERVGRDEERKELGFDRVAEVEKIRVEMTVVMKVGKDEKRGVVLLVVGRGGNVENMLLLLLLFLLVDWVLEGMVKMSRARATMNREKA